MATLVAYWKLDETSGTSLADSSGSNALTLNAGYTLNVTPPAALSFSTGAVRGTTSCIAKKTTGVSGLPGGNVTQSWSMWIKLVSTSSDQVIFSLVQGGTQGAGLAIWDGGTNLAIVEYSSAASMITATPPSTGTWHHVAWTFDSATNAQLLYVDGTQVASVTSAPTAATIDQILLGTFDGATGDPVAGDIDDIRVYTGVLTPTEVSTLASGGQVPPTGVTLTGQAATVSRGTATPAVSPPLTGQAATASRGTATPAIAPALTGQAASSARGTLGPAVSVALTGLAATVQQGTVTPPAGGNALTGQQATTARGTPVPSVSVALTGLAASAAGGSLTGATSPPLTGLSSTTATGAMAGAISVPLAGSVATVGLGTLTPPVPPVSLAITMPIPYTARMT